MSVSALAGSLGVRHLRGSRSLRRLGRRHVAVFAAGANGVLLVAALGLHAVNGPTDLTQWWWGNPAIGLVSGLCGLLITANRPANVVGWLLVVAGLTESACGAGRELGVLAVVHGVPGGAWCYAAADPLWVGGYCLLPVVLMVFPDGHPVAPRWRAGMVLAGVAMVTTWAAAALSPGSSTVAGHAVANPAGVLPPLGARIALDAATWLSVATLTVAVASILVRHHRAEPDLRLQLRWLVVAGTADAFELGTELLPFNSWETYTGPVAAALFCAAVVVAVLRHNLWDIDVILNRSAVFLVLSIGVAACYLGVVAVFGWTTGRDYDLVSSLLAAAMVAVAFAPARSRVQRAVDRALYGSRRDPYGALSRLGERIGDAAVPGAELAVLAETVAQTLKLAYVRIDGADGRELASVGTLRTAPFRVPLAFLGQAMGELVVGPPSGHDRLGPGEQRLIVDMAAQMGPAVHAVRLGTDLQASRLRLVTAKEEERRRLRRDLHDGLGPKLAAIRLHLDNTTGLLSDGSGEARRALQQVTGYLKEAIDDVRGLVYGLRPPALDQLGLVPALRDRARQVEDGAADPVRVSVTDTGDLHDLPAAVEVALYWIATEALTNVARHAGAHRVEVALVRDDQAVTVTVDDDGVGVDEDRRRGVGSASMVERAAELGGTCTVGAGPGRGTRVQARLPLPAVAGTPA